MGNVVGSVRVLPHPANNQMVNVKPMACSSSFLVLMFVNFLFLVEVILVNLTTFCAGCKSKYRVGLERSLPPNA